MINPSGVLDGNNPFGVLNGRLTQSEALFWLEIESKTIQPNRAHTSLNERILKGL